MFAIETFKNAVAKRAERAAQGTAESSTQVGSTTTEIASLTRHVTELENQVGFLRTAYEDERAARLAMEKKLNKSIDETRKRVIDVEVDLETKETELRMCISDNSGKYDNVIRLQEANLALPPSKKRKLAECDPSFVKTFWEKMEDDFTPTHNDLKPLEPFFELYKRDCDKNHQDYLGFESFYGGTLMALEGHLTAAVANGPNVKGVPTRMIRGKLLKKK